MLSMAVTPVLGMEDPKVKDKNGLNILDDLKAMGIPPPGPSGREARQAIKPPRDQIFLEGSESWVLYDANKRLPSNGLSPVFKKFARFAPGNRKVVAWNLRSGAVGLRTTPAEFEGYEVKYRRRGPRLYEPASPNRKKSGAEETRGDESPDLGEIADDEAAQEEAASQKQRVGEGDDEESEEESDSDGEEGEEVVLWSPSVRGKNKGRA